jgi:hypothetical protein
MLAAMTTNQLIKLFGGLTALGEVVGCSASGVGNWRRDGIPFRHFGAIIAEAERRRLPGTWTFEALERTRPTRRAA